METSPTTIRLRASALWVPGVLAVVLGVLIHTHVESLRRQHREVTDNSTVCRLPVSLAEPSAQEVSFAPSRNGTGAVRLVLATALPVDRSASEPSGGDDFPADAISRALGTATLEIRWKIRSEGRADIDGVISEKDLRKRTQGDGIRYVFGDQTVQLVAGRKYQLTAEEAIASPELNDFAPTLAIEASSPLKGHPLAGWRLRDTGLLLFLGGSLISLGVSKRYSDRKKHRMSARVSVASDSQ